ncbi:MAG TPA: hypothetical protein VLT61_17820 [Anaeromyxobacteraceae bacterium]|nr:hypothetical protein [Anaeromyxobacteraceae bacterium]
MEPRPPRRDEHLNPAPSGAGFLVSSIAILCASSLPATGVAGELGGSVELGAGAVHFDYAEHGRNGAFLDGEEGWVPGLELRSELARGRLFLVASGRLAKGNVTYEGRTQSSAPANDDLPIATTTRADFARVELQGGGWLGAGRRVGLYAGAAARRWRRDIRPTTVVSRAGATIQVSGLEEVYAWGELQAGLRLAAVEHGRLRLELDGRLLQVVLPRLAVDWAGERVGLRLGALPGWRLGATLRVELASPWFAALEGSAEGYRFGASEVDPASGIMEPESATTDVELGARLGARF